MQCVMCLTCRMKLANCANAVVNTPKYFVS